MGFFDEDVDENIPAKKVVGKPKDKDEISLEYRNNPIINTLWVEKYRPRELKDYVGNLEFKKRISKQISEGDISHLLLYGSAGTGKTSISKLITGAIECDVLYINASDENSVDVVRDKIKGFASSTGFKPLKVCILDECDFLSQNAMAALRNLMETYSSHTRFILTCNYVEKIIPALISRCQVEEVKPPSKKDIAIHVKSILETEGISFDIKDIAFIVNSYYPDIRKIIGSLQQFSREDSTLKIDTSKIISGDFKLKIAEIIKTSDKKSAYKEIRQILADNSISNFDEIFKYLYDNVDDWAPKATAQCILILAEMQYKSSMVPDKEINFMSSVIQVLDVLK